MLIRPPVYAQRLGSSCHVERAHILSTQTLQVVTLSVLFHYNLRKQATLSIKMIASLLAPTHNRIEHTTYNNY